MNKYRFSVRAFLALALALVCAAAGSAVFAPAQARAVEVEKLTARPNTDGGSEVVGGEETRLTLEFQADADESLTGISVTLPEGTTCSSVDDDRVTVLSGADLMESERLSSVDFDLDGQTVTASFDAVQAGRYYRLELWGITFPVSGGEQQVKAGYELADGSTHKMSGVPTVDIESVSFADKLKSDLEEQPWVQAWNSNLFCKLFLNPPVIVSSIPIVFEGFLMALKIVLVAFPLAIPVALCLALMRISSNRAVRGIANVYVNVVRGTPAFLQIYIFFFGLPLAGINIDNYPLGVIVMGMNSAAYLCEIFRAGIQSIPKGQNEAARSICMNPFQTMLYVIVPQMVRNVLPTMTNEFILLYKDTSLLAAVGVSEIVMGARTIVATTGSITPYVVAALFYLALTLPLSKFVEHREDKIHGRAGDGGKSGPSAGLGKFMGL